MQPITRETITDRRQSAIHWSAILAGTAVALGLWGAFQVIGLGTGLREIDPDNAHSLRNAVLGMSSFSALAPMVAAFVGGWLAARIVASYDRKVSAGHALIVWGLTTAAGLAATTLLASAAAGAAHVRAHVSHQEQVYDDAADGPSAPLDRVIADEDAPLLFSSAERLAVEHARALGKGLMTLGVSILLSIGTALLGGIVGMRTPEDRRGRTAPYPVQPDTLS